MLQPFQGIIGGSRITTLSKGVFCFFVFIHMKFTINRQRLPDDATRSMEIHSNPATITFNIEIQINIKLHTHTKLKEQKINVGKKQITSERRFLTTNLGT